MPSNDRPKRVRNKKRKDISSSASEDETPSKRGRPQNRGVGRPPKSSSKSTASSKTKKKVNHSDDATDTASTVNDFTDNDHICVRIFLARKKSEIKFTKDFSVVKVNNKDSFTTTLTLYSTFDDVKGSVIKLLNGLDKQFEFNESILDNNVVLFCRSKRQTKKRMDEGTQNITAINSMEEFKEAIFNVAFNIHSDGRESSLGGRKFILDLLAVVKEIKTDVIDNNDEEDDTLQPGHPLITDLKIHLLPRTSESIEKNSETQMEESKYLCDGTNKPDSDPILIEAPGADAEQPRSYGYVLKRVKTVAMFSNYYKVPGGGHVVGMRSGIFYPNKRQEKKMKWIKNTEGLWKYVELIKSRMTKTALAKGDPIELYLSVGVMKSTDSPYEVPYGSDGEDDDGDVEEETNYDKMLSQQEIPYSPEIKKSTKRKNGPSERESMTEMHDKAMSFLNRSLQSPCSELHNAFTKEHAEYLLPRLKRKIWDGNTAYDYWNQDPDDPNTWMKLSDLPQQLYGPLAKEELFGGKLPQTGVYSPLPSGSLPSFKKSDEGTDDRKMAALYSNVVRPTLMQLGHGGHHNNNTSNERLVVSTVDKIVIRLINNHQHRRQIDIIESQKNKTLHDIIFADTAKDVTCKFPESAMKEYKERKREFQLKVGNIVTWKKQQLKEVTLQDLVDIVDWKKGQNITCYVSLELVGDDENLETMSIN